MTDDTTTTSEPMDLRKLSPAELHDQIAAAEARVEQLKEEGSRAILDGRAKSEDLKPAARAAVAEVVALRREAKARGSLRLNPSFEPVEVVDLPEREDRPEEFSELFPALGVSLADRPRAELRALHADRVAKLEALRGRTLDVDLSRSDRKREERIGRAQVERLTGVLAGGRAVAEERSRFRRWRRKLDSVAAEILTEPTPPPAPRPRDPRKQMILAAVMSSPELVGDLELKRRDDVLVDGEPTVISGVILEDRDVWTLVRVLSLLADCDGVLTMDYGRQTVAAPRVVRLGRDIRLAAKHLAANGYLTIDGRTIGYGPLVHEIAARWGIDLADAA